MDASQDRAVDDNQMAADIPKIIDAVENARQTAAGLASMDNIEAARLDLAVLAASKRIFNAVGKVSASTGWPCLSVRRDGPGGGTSAGRRKSRIA